MGGLWVQMLMNEEKGVISEDIRTTREDKFYPFEVSCDDLWMQNFELPSLKSHLEKEHKIDPSLKINGEKYIRV